MKFYYVQRLSSAPEGTPVNVFGSNPSVTRALLDAGAKVDLDYMGSSEFEGSIPIESGNRIASVAQKLRVVTQKLVRSDQEEDVHFVCTDEQAEGLLPKWHRWAQSPKPVTIEPTGYFGDKWEEIVGWWALKEDLIWSGELEVAEAVRGAFVILANQSQEANS